MKTQAAKGPRPLHISNAILRASDLSKIKTFIQCGADINSRDKRGKTALWWAAFNGNVELVDFLLTQQANPHLADNLNRTPLNIASELALQGNLEIDGINIHAEIVKWLTEYIATCSQKTNPGREEPTEDLTTHMSH